MVKMSDNITIFKPEFYDRVKQRIVGLSELEEALTFIQNDTMLIKLLEEYVKNSPSEYKEDDLTIRGSPLIVLYRREYKLPKFKSWQEGQVLKVELSLRPTSNNPTRFNLAYKELSWWDAEGLDPESEKKNGNWAVYWCRCAGWETSTSHYNVEQINDKVGYYLISIAKPGYRGPLNNKRVSQVEQLRKVKKRDILSNLEKELERLSI